MRGSSKGRRSRFQVERVQIGKLSTICSFIVSIRDRIILNSPAHLIPSPYLPNVSSPSPHHSHTETTNLQFSLHRPHHLHRPPTLSHPSLWRSRGDATAFSCNRPSSSRRNSAMIGRTPSPMSSLSIKQWIITGKLWEKLFFLSLALLGELR